MIEKLECPNCNHIFDYNGSSSAECPKCGIFITISTLDDPTALQIAYKQATEVILETQEVYEQVSNLDDDSLCDEISHILAHFNFPINTENILVECFDTGKLSKSSRALAEGTYVLAYTLKGLGDVSNVN